jgi:hypothetical protein
VKNTLKFLGIGFALVMLLVSQQIGNDQSAEAAVATLTENSVKWLSYGDAESGTANVVTAGTAVKHYSAGSNASDVAHFYIQDKDLNVVQSGTTVFVPAYTAGTDATEFDDEAAVTVADDEAVTLGADATNCLGDSTLVCAESNTAYAGAATDGSGGATTPLVPGSFRLYHASADLTGGHTDYIADVAKTVEYAASVYDNINYANGTFMFTADQSVDTAAGTGVIAEYDFNVADNKAASLKRAKVTSTSDTNGEWIDINEINAIGGETAAQDSKYFMGRVAFDTNAGAGASGTTCSRTVEGSATNVPCIWVKDGDTVTITYYEEIDSDGNVGAEIATATTTIDSSAPTITNISPADGTLTSDTSPQLSLTINDDGVGFDSALANYGDHILLKVNDRAILDTEISVSAHSTSSITYTFDLAGTVEFDGATSDANNTTRTTGQGFDISDSATGSMSDATNDRKIHGTAFNWTIVATDDVGNSKTLDDDDLNLHIDSVAPAYASNVIAVAWDAVDLTNDVVDKSSISITMTESVDTSTVEPTDFVVSGTGVATGTTIDSVSFGGNDGNQNTIIYLNLSADLAPNATPKIEFQGQISDLAGNVLKVASSDSDGKVDWDAAATDNIAPTISNVVLADNYLDDNDETTLTFTADEALTASGASATLNACTCAYAYGGNAKVSIAGDNAESTRIDVTLSDETTGSVDIKEAVAPFNVTHGLFGVQIVGRDVNNKVGYGGIVQVKGEDISDHITSAVTDNQDYEDKIKLDNWPLADHDGDGDLDNSITKVSINGSTTNNSAVVTAIDWSYKETLDITFQTDSNAQIATTDVVKIDYWYIDTTVEIDNRGPLVKVTPANDGTTEDVRQRITIDWSQAASGATAAGEGEDEYGFDTHKTVTMTLAELTDPAGTVTDIKDSLITSDSVSYYYKPTADLALGSYSLKLKGEDENANASAETTIKFTVNEKAKTTIAMEAGWNLISVPSNPVDTAINSVIDNAEVTTVLTYDPAVPGGWLTAVRDGGVLTGTLDTIDATRAYWVYQEDGDDIKTLIPAATAGVQSIPPAINVVKGWNLLPVASMNNASGNVKADTYLANLDWMKAKGWDASNELWIDVISDTGDGNLADGDNMVIGKGYWVFANKAGTLIP